MNKWLNSLAIRILAHIQERKSMSFYYRKLQLSPTGGFMAISDLEKKGLIRKERKGRECKIVLTERGKIAQEQIWSLNRLLS